MTRERPRRGPSFTCALLMVLIVGISCAARAASSNPQVFTGSTPSVIPMSCAGAEAIPTAIFKKQSVGTPTANHVQRHRLSCREQRRPRVYRREN